MAMISVNKIGNLNIYGTPEAVVRNSVIRTICAKKAPSLGDAGELLCGSHSLQTQKSSTSVTLASFPSARNATCP